VRKRAHDRCFATGRGTHERLAEAPKFIDITMPDQFVLEVPTEQGGWIDHGLFRASDFDRLDDGAYLCAGHGGSPVYLRCLRTTR